MSDRMQEKFEAYASEEDLFLHLLSDGMYDHDTLIAWKAYQVAWNASRRELVEDLRKLEWAPCVLQEAIDAADLR